MNQVLFSKLIGKKIRLVRNHLGLTQKDFSVVLGVMQSQLSKIERGVQSVTVCQVCQLAEMYEINLEWFFDEIKTALDQGRRISGFPGQSMLKTAGSRNRLKVN